MSLADQSCVPCKGGVPTMDGARAQELLGKLDEGWALNADGHLERTYTFSNFVEAIGFANRVGDIAEDRITIRICTSLGASAPSRYGRPRFRA